MNIYEKLQKVRAELQKSNLKKSGKNKFAHYEYFELGDFLPTINQLLADNKMASIFKFGADEASLMIVNTEKIDEFIPFSTPVVMAQLSGATDIQALGATQTYIRRYLYVMAFEIAEHDTVDAVDNSKTDHIEELQDLTPEAAAQYKIPFGKHKGKTVIEVFNNHGDYIDWFMKNGTDQKVKQAFTVYTDSLNQTDADTGSDEPIDKVKITVIETMLLKTKTDKKTFLDFYHLDNIEQMTNSVFITAMKTLERKASQMPKEQQSDDELPNV